MNQHLIGLGSPNLPGGKICGSVVVYSDAMVACSKVLPTCGKNKRVDVKDLHL